MRAAMKRPPGIYVDIGHVDLLLLFLFFFLLLEGGARLALVFLIFSSLLATRSMIVITDLNAQGGLVVKSGETFTTSVAKEFVR